MAAYFLLMFITQFMIIYRSSIIKWLKIESRRGKHKSSRVRDKWCNVICNDFLHNRLIEIIQPNIDTCMQFN